MMIDQLEENLTLANYAEHMEEINRLARSRDASCRIRPAAGLIRMFGRCNYRNQCAILNSLSDVYPEISRSSQERIRRFCQELADRDMCAAVQEAYDRLIRISRHRL